ncbi:hypothetical protein [Flavobacterium luminosum]|uniref:Uncharacterized protein n=1 Tax=Flavobacterium luminosum TaxID=2949086 RepID=A0ABT0TS34_9FLAO|nr:hypothetical protein [Flavobacterium sp. HXWNR70]MCL9810106.1 hypothetical protein [Flavobacterium sp. HXWNR70]
MEILLVHIILGVGLFFLINWIGKHSYSIGYMEISIFVKTEEAPALNFLIRVLTPIVYIIIVSTSLYYFGLDKFVWNIYLVNIYYILFRLIFNLATNRGLLLNWYRQFLYWTAIVVISYFTYEKLIKVKANILPDFTTVANELWIIILIFIFQVANNLRFSQEATQKRKDKYLKSCYHYFKRFYGQFIKDLTNNEILESIVYAIIIYEDFNRPKIARQIENLKFKLTKKPHTLGVMQVRSDKLISDLESVKIGTEKIVNAYKKYLENPTENSSDYFDWYAKNYIINDYNVGTSYNGEVNELADIIKNTFYKDTNDTLDPNKKNAL